MRQDDAGEFLQLLLASSAELREMFAQETFHEDTYVPQCSTCEGRVVPTAEHEVLLDVFFPEEKPRKTDLSVCLSPNRSVAEFETQHTCSCGEVYRAERATLRAFGPGRVLALRIMRNKDRREVLRVPLTLRLEAREFRPRAGVCHSGSSYQCGHYTCFAPLSDGKQWVLYDDGAVQVCSVPKELCLASRVLFYELAELATEPTGQMEASRLEVAKTEEELVAPALPEDAAPAMRASGEQNVHVEEVAGALVADGEGDAANWKSAVADESVVAAASLIHALEEVAEGMETTCGLCDEELKCLEHMHVGRGQDALEHDAERLLRVFERTEDPSACHALLQELPAFLSQDGAQTVHAAANAWHAELSDLSEDCVNGVTAMQVQPFVGDTALYPLLVLLPACSWATDMPLVFYTDILRALVGSILRKELFVQLNGRWKTKNRCWAAAS